MLQSDRGGGHDGRCAIAGAAREPAPPIPDSSGTILSGGLQRQYDLHVPAQRPDAPVPLVIVLHGGGGTDDAVGMIRDLTRFNALADRERFVVAYPKGVENYWNDGRGVRRYRSHRENIDDVGFIAALADRLTRTQASIGGASTSPARRTAR